MSTPEKPEKPSTYIVQDRSNQEEMRRVAFQDQFLTAQMGGVLPEQPDPTRFQSVLDVGCGTGKWLIELAQTVPTATRLVGVDVSHTFVEYARSQAEAAGVSDRVTFHTMDALLILDFRNQSFDLVNHRSGSSWLRTWDWPKLLSEYRRICRRNGIVRITEAEMSGPSTSPAHMRLAGLLIQAMYQSGHLFTPTSEGLINELEHLLAQHGLRELQTRSCHLELRSGAPEAQAVFEATRMVYRTALPFLRKWTKLPDDYEEIYQQMLIETGQPDFVGGGKLLTVWGKV
jgi:ubiquinone/menaquinone biosynthesis C-methylase UbiE